MKAAVFALLAILACVAAVSMVSAQNIVVAAPPPAIDPATGLPIVTEEPAIIGRPRHGLKKPIIFNPTPVNADANSDEPLIGKAPANLKKSAVSEHIYGGAPVAYEVGREVGGCPCKRAVPEKYRYDTKWKKEFPKFNACGCAIPAPKPEDALPPVIARIRREPKVLAFNVTLPTNGTHVLYPNGTLAALPKVVEKIAPDYYRFPRDINERIQARINATLSVPCTNCAKLHEQLLNAAKKPESVQPHFYPTLAQRRERRRARRAAAREAARKAAAAAAVKKF